MTLETARTRTGIEYEYAADQHIDNGNADDWKKKNNENGPKKIIQNFHKNNTICNVKRSATELNS